MMTSSDVVKLDIGGTIFRTTKATLCSVDGYFSGMFRENSNWDHSHSSEPIFIDRDPETFPTILSYLRSHQFFISEDDDEMYLMKLLTEADYYMINELSNNIKQYFETKRIQQQEKKETEEFNKPRFKENVVYKIVSSDEAEAYFRNGWSFISQFYDVETLGCSAATGTRKRTTFLKFQNRCEACGEAMVYDKFKQHVTYFQPCMIVIKGTEVIELSSGLNVEDLI